MYIEQYVGSCETFAEKQAITCLSTGRTLAYRDVERLTNRLSNKFRKSGFKKEDVVMVCLFNTYHLPIIMLGAWKNLMVFSPINYRLSAGEVKIHIEDSKPKVFIYDSDLEETVEAALTLCDHKPDVLVSTGAPRIKEALEFDKYIEGVLDEDPELMGRIKTLDFERDEIERLYTSGTTGSPKGVRYSSQSLMNLAFKTLHNNGYSSNDRMMNLTPWFHSGGLITAVQPGLLVGAHIYGLKKFDAAEALGVIEKYRMTFVAGAPATFNAMAQAQETLKRDLGTLRLIHSMGSPASSREFLLWQGVFAHHVVNSYGVTEMASTLCLRSDIHPIEEKAGSAGRPFIFVQARVIKLDEENGRVEPDDMVRNDGQEIGQIIAKSAGMFIGYHNRPEEEQKKLYKGWFYTGDTATIDKDGFITVQGRTDDMFVSGGENMFPQPVEDVLMRHPKVRDCAVVGMNDQKWGQVSVAYILPSDNTVNAEELDAHCLKDPGLSNYRRPRYYRFVGELPYTPTGKKMRYVLRQQANKKRDEFIMVRSRS